jgi:hypothetical protein
MLEFKFCSPETIWEYEMSSVQEVYEAILATAPNAFDPAAIALHDQLSDTAFSM